MKFDMHCHTKEGSPDAKVSIDAYITLLKEQGFNGMLVSDHDSYEGYRYWRENIKGKKHKDFVVLRGVEYDTLDAGHFLVIMPTGVSLKILEHKGMPVWLLLAIVHKHHGILGPAHPYGERFLSIFNTGIFKRTTAIAGEFDFIEGFNACEDLKDNIKAQRIGKQYKLPAFGGSDSHRFDCVGKAFTEFPVDIKSEDDLISYVKNKGRVVCGGERYVGTTKDKLGAFNHLLVQAFWFYNRVGALIHSRKRKLELIKIEKRSILHK